MRSTSALTARRDVVRTARPRSSIGPYGGDMAPFWQRRGEGRVDRAPSPGPVRPAADVHGAADRALDAWGHLVGSAMAHRPGAVRVHDALDPRSPVAALWPFSQVLHAAVDVARLDEAGGAATPAPRDPVAGDAHLTDPARLVDALYGALATYRSGEGYATHPGGSHRFYDDDAWVGLAAVQAHRQRAGRAAAEGWLPVARRAATFVVSGQDPDGGVRWEERRRPPSPRNACSTAPAIALALAMADLDPDASDRWVGAAAGADAWLHATLVAPDGLVWDHVEPDGRVERTVWSYNLGSVIGADLAWWRRTGEPARLDRARTTAARALDHLTEGDRLWGQPPAFDAVFFRNLLALHATDEVPGAVEALDAYLDRAWTTARHPRTGRFTEGGIGHYDDGGTLDHAALVQLFALRATPEAWATEIT